MPGEITIHQLFQTPTITGIISRIKTPLSLLQNFYNLQVGGSASKNEPGRNIGWDIFDSTRTMAQVRAPGTGPGTTSQKPVGHVSAQVMRLHEKIVLLQEYIARTRPPGSQFGTLDGNGMQYVRRQLTYGTRRFRNAREFMVSRMFRGGFGVKVGAGGDEWTLCETDTSGVTFTVDFQVPSANKTYLELGSGADIITAPWDDPATQVMSQLYAINRAYERLHGWRLEHIWINSTRLADLMLNLEFQAVGGSAYRVFDSLTKRDITSEEGRPDTGFEIVFRAVPQFRFHVYDGVLSALSPTTVDGTAEADVSRIIPDNNAIFTPEPSSEWLGLINGSEYIAENVMDQGKEVYGFHNWTTRVIDPAGWELKLLDNCLPALFLPKTVSYGTIAGF
jgi:hypothetical protein